MRIKYFLLGILTLIALDNSPIQAQVTDVQLILRTRVVELANRQFLFLKAVTRFDDRPDRVCRVRLMGSLSRIGNSEAAPRRQLIATKRLSAGDPRSVRFRYLGPAINGNDIRQNQINLQAKVRCTDQEPIITDADATNITCDDGVRRREFIDTLKRNLLVD